MTKRILALSVLLILTSPGCFSEGSDFFPLRSCFYNTDCFWDEFCSDYGWCKQMNGCSTDATCPQGYYCEVDGECIVRRNCSYGYDCPDGSYCSNSGICRTSVGCFSGRDCPVGHQCDAQTGTCHLVKGCQVHSDCDPGYSCGSIDVSNVCVYIGTCADGISCKDPGYYCAGGGFCYVNNDCTKDSDCASGRYCDFVGSQKCVEVKYCDVSDENSCPPIIPDELRDITCENAAIDCASLTNTKYADAVCSPELKCEIAQYCDGIICRQGGCSSQQQCAPGLVCNSFGLCELP